MKSIILKDNEATIELGKIIASKIIKINKPSVEIHLEGDLGLSLIHI